MIRSLHLYLGTLFAPVIIFFAFSGIFQTLGLHEAENPDKPQPAAWIVVLASLHRDQHLPRLSVDKQSDARAKMPSDDSADGESAHEHAPKHAHEHDASDSVKPAPDPGQGRAQAWLKGFVVLMAAGLILSASLGIAIALTNARTRRIALLMLCLGIVVPVGLMLV